jgi:uncharacterized 2Fe-2S/4Fe-4S cluster protein (DUF4445 family)
MEHSRLRYDPERDGALQDFLFSEGVEFPCGGTSLCGGCRIRVVSGSVPATAEMRDVLSERDLRAGWRLACRAEARGLVELEVAQWSQQILTDEATVPFEPRPGIGAVVDVGTTTLVVQQVDLASGEVTRVVTALNDQRRRGADVMTRIEYELRRPGELREMIRAQVRAMVAPMGPLEEILLVGNTCMHHLFCGLSVEPLAAMPFRSPHLGAQTLPPAVLGAEAVFLPCAGGFVGSDLLAGLVATGLLDSSEPGALLDLGTNGEVAVGNRDSIMCASTAAGPAFEGGRITQGMRAGQGAIDRVTLRDGALECHVIGGAVARGLCGSGLVDAVAAALELGWIAPSGRLTNGRGDIKLAAGVRLTQSDIRELQLAKGAVAAGLRLLSENRPIPGERVFLAGAFGNYIRAESARRINLLPSWATAPVAAGNTALRGARMLLLAPSSRAAILERCRATVRHIELASDALFRETFVECLHLAETRDATASRRGMNLDVY